MPKRKREMKWFWILLAILAVVAGLEHFLNAVFSSSLLSLFTQKTAQWIQGIAGGATIIFAGKFLLKKLLK